jgi:predicted ferric reductase
MVIFSTIFRKIKISFVYYKYLTKQPRSGNFAIMIRRDNILGWLIVLISCLATWVIWLTTLSSYVFIWKDPFLFLSKAVVLPGIILMCWSFFLSTRFRVFEMLFNGLDKTYHAHKMISISSFVLICLHPALQFFRFLPNYRKSLEMFIPKALTALEFGLLALLVFIALITLTLWIKLPYHIWKKTHQFFIVVLLLALIHIWLIDKQVHDSLPLMIWIYGFIGAACIAYIYTRFLYRFLGPKYNYKVVKIKKMQTCWDVYMTAQTTKEIAYYPAQFVYISFNNKMLGSEPHPFSISSASHQPFRLSIKNSGDYTSKLDALMVGDSARIWGPYGRFYEKYLCEPKKDAVMIAGGIGITPFLSLIHHEVKHPKPRKTILFYGVKNRDHKDYIDEIAACVLQNHNIKIITSFFEIEPLNMQIIESYTDKDLTRYNFFLCGPIKMMKLFEEDLKKRGVKNRNIIFEDFNLFG